MQQKLQFLSFLFILIFSISCANNTIKKDQKEKGNIALSELDSLNQLIAKDTTTAKLYQARAEHFLNEKDLSSAKYDLVKAIRLDSLNSDLYVRLSEIYLAEGKFQNGVLALQKAIQLDQKNIDAILSMAEINLIAKNTRETANYIDKAMKIDDLNPRSYYLRGLMWLQEGDTIVGIKNFQQALFVDTEFYEANVQLGLLYAGKKNDLAIDYYNSALNTNPNNPDIHYSLALFYQNTNRYEKAVSIYDQIIEKFPKYTLAYYNKAYIYLTVEKNYQKAVEYFSKAIDRSPNYANAYYNRAISRLALNDTTGVREDLERTLELKPEHKWAKIKLKGLH